MPAPSVVAAPSPKKRTNVRSWFAPQVVVAEVRRRWATWPIDARFDLDLHEDEILADLHVGRA